MVKVRKNQILDTAGNPMRFFGVNCAGLEWNSRDDHIEASVHAALEEWKVNLIRLPVSQDRWFGFAREQKEAQNFIAYRELVDRIVADAKQHNAVILLDLHWSDMGVWGENIGQHSMPDMNSVVFWRDAAYRYKDADNVIFGLYNEPKNVSWELWRNGGTVTEQVKNRETKRMRTYRYETPGMAGLIRVIRETGAKNAIVVGGLDWAYTFEHMIDEVGDLNDIGEGNGLIFDTHIYPWKRLEWDLDVTVISKLHPVLVGEYGHYGNEAKPREGKQSLPSEEWIPRLFSWINKHKYSCCAWDFHPHAGPSLIKNFEYEPTEFYGIFVKDFIRKGLQK